MKPTILDKNLLGLFESQDGLDGTPSEYVNWIPEQT